MRNILFIICLWGAALSMAQSSSGIEYGYDTSGNRILRKIVTISLRQAQAPEEVVNVEEEWRNRTIRIFPNPTRGDLRVVIDGGDEGLMYTYTLYTLSGRELQRGVTPAGELLLSLHDYQKGIYLLEIECDDERLSYKIIKE